MREILAYGLIWILIGGCAPRESTPGETLSEKQRKDLSFDYAQRATLTQQGTALEKGLLDMAIQIDSLNDRAWLEKASWLIKIGDYKRYASCINKAVELNPLANLGYRARNKLYCLRDYTGALEDLARLDSLTPNFIDYPWGENIDHLRGLSYMQLGDREKAVEAFSRCIDETIRSKGEEWIDVYTFVWRGKLRLEQNLTSESIKDFNTALRFHPNCPEAFYYKGIALLKDKRRLREACAAFDKALEFAGKGYINTTPYRDMFEELYIVDIEDQIKIYCPSE